MAVARKFTSLSLKRGERLVRGYRVECSKCGATESLAVNTFKGHGGDDENLAAFLTKKFEAKGWKLGGGVTSDVCMACRIIVPTKGNVQAPLKLVGAAMKSSTSNTSPAASVVAEAGQVAFLPVETSAAPSPRELGVMDALTIREKLMDVYLDKERGYDQGFTDAKVADALNVPRDWVKQVREHVYGKGSAGNGDIAEVLAEARNVLAEVNSTVAGVDRMAADLKKISDAIAPLRSAASRIERDLRHVEQSLK